MGAEPTMLPLFPLGTALVPGMLMPLHLFEMRYRTLAEDLAALPANERRFGIIGIRAGSEVGQDVTNSLFPVGTVAEVTEMATNADGTVDINTVGSRRFTIEELNTDRAYLTARVHFLDEHDGDDPEQWAPLVRALLAEYRDAVGLNVQPESLAPRILSYVVTAAAVLEAHDKQALLACPDTATRLKLAEHLLRDELRIIRVLGTLPATELVRSPQSVN